MPRKRRDVPWLETRENGVFYVCWYDIEVRRTRRRSLHTADGRAAQNAYAQFLLNGREIYEQQVKELGPTVGYALDQYIREHAEVRCNASKRQINAAKNLKAFFEGTLLKDVDIDMSRRYLDARTSGLVGVGSKRGRGEKAGKPATVRRELNVLVAAANHALKWKRITAEMLPSVEMPEAKSSETPWYQKKELDALLEAAKAMAAADERQYGHLYRFIRIAYYTAARRASIQNLAVSQILTGTGVIRLDKPGVKRTVKRRPIVPLYQVIRPDIDWLIGEAEGGRLFGKRDFYRPYRKLCQAIGLGHKAHPHILRHSRATHLLLDGVNIYDVAKLLGDTVRTVETTYAHACSDHLATTTGG